MSSEISISQEQANMIGAGVQPALETLLATGNFVPTLYVHGDEGIIFFNLAAGAVEELHTMSRLAISEKVPGALAYVLLYDSSLETGNGPRDVLIIETGDTEDEEAHEFAWVYSRETNTAATKMIRLGAAPHLLR